MSEPACRENEKQNQWPVERVVVADCRADYVLQTGDLMRFVSKRENVKTNKECTAEERQKAKRTFMIMIMAIIE